MAHFQPIFRFADSPVESNASVSTPFASQSHGSAAVHKIRRRRLVAHSGNGIEHRWGERVRVNIPVLVSAVALSGIDSCIKNISLSGALINSACDLRLHSLIEVSIELPSPSRRIAVIKAHVSRKLKEGVGVEWCEFAPSIVKDLLRSPSVRMLA
jgi:hypothetical protein